MRKRAANGRPFSVAAMATASATMSSGPSWSTRCWSPVPAQSCQRATSVRLITWLMPVSSAALEVLLHGLHALLDAPAHVLGELAGQDVRDPHRPAAPTALGEDLQRCIVMGELG